MKVEVCQLADRETCRNAFVVMRGRQQPTFHPDRILANHRFNAAAFAYPGASASSPLTPPTGPIGRYGTAGVGIITGPGTWQEDLGLRKEIPIFERLKANLFVLATNVFNH